jgi:serine/threonine protein kinase
LLFGKSPFLGSDLHQLLQKIKTKNLSSSLSKLKNKAIRDVLQKMLQIKPEKRISWEELFEHPGSLLTHSGLYTGK